MRRKLAALTTVPVLAMSMVGCGSLTGSDSEGAVDVNRVRVVLGSSSTTADTYQATHNFSTHVGEELGVNMKADAVGRSQAYQALEKAQADGSTIMSYHDSGYLSVIYGATPAKYDLENWTVGPVYAANPTSAFLAAHDAPYDDLTEAAQWLVDNESETVRVAIEPGGMSELSFDAFYLWVADEHGQDVADRIKVFATGSDEEKNQALWAGNADIVFGSITGNEQYVGDDVKEDVREKFLNIIASERIEGYDIPTFAEQGIGVDGEPFAFDKEYYILMPKDVDEDYAAAVDEAVRAVAESDDFAEDLAKANIKPNYIPLEESADHLVEKRDMMQSIVDAAPDVADLTN